MRLWGSDHQRLIYPQYELVFGENKKSSLCLESKHASSLKGRAGTPI